MQYLHFLSNLTSGSKGRGKGSKLAKFIFKFSGSANKVCSFSILRMRLPLSRDTAWKTKHQTLKRMRKKFPIHHETAINIFPPSTTIYVISHDKKVHLDSLILIHDNNENIMKSQRWYKPISFYVSVYQGCFFPTFCIESTRMTNNLLIFSWCVEDLLRISACTFGYHINATVTTITVCKRYEKRTGVASPSLHREEKWMKAKRGQRQSGKE